MTDYRRETSKSVRVSAAELAEQREHPQHHSNGDEEKYAGEFYLMNFTKGLEHCEETGLIECPEDFRAFRRAIDGGEADEFSTSVRVAGKKDRKWEAPTAGFVHDLQGPDCQAVTMPPAPPLGSLELAYEMAEVYELALLRDEQLRDFSSGSGNAPLQNSLDRLNGTGFDISGSDGQRPRKGGTGVDAGNVIDQTAFRGSSPGVEHGPYLSQFLLLGNTSVAGEFNPEDGLIQYGPLSIDQKVPVAIAGKDFMTTWDDWLCVQNGADTGTGMEVELYGSSVDRRFITTGRDLATYVHYDALYEAYLNACLMLLGMGAPSDPAFDRLSGAGKWYDTTAGKKDREAGGFALWGGPHVLTLVCEVATRALKAVRFQKFNMHCRLRPEALSGRIEKCATLSDKLPIAGRLLVELEAAIADTVAAVRGFNTSRRALLPMAFQEGSPMHPSYGAGHATVAGACVTILKAFFDTSAVLVSRDGKTRFSRYEHGDTPVAYVPDRNDHCLLENVSDGCFLTLEGELNKLAANISIGRNFAGVHYFSDYYDSLRMGEAIAIGILEEQALCYPKDAFLLTVPTFDGEVRRIGKG